MKLDLLSNASATGLDANIQNPGRYCFAVAGTFGGATVGLDIMGPDGATWIAIEDSAGTLAFTAAKAVLVDLPAGKFRARVTGGAGVALFASLATAGA